MTEKLPITTPLATGWRAAISGMSAFSVGLKMMLPGGGLFRYAVAPVLVSLVVLVGLIVLCVVGTQWWLADLMNSWDWPEWLSWVGGIFVLLVALVIAWFTFIPLMGVFGPLFFDPIAEKIYFRYTGRELTDPSAKSYWRRQLFAIIQSVKSVAISLCIELPLAIASLFTGVATFVAVPVSGFIEGFDLMDYPLALRGQSFGDKWQWCKENQWAVLGLGVSASFCLLVPVLNLFVIPAGVVGATLLYIGWERGQEQQNHSDSEPLEDGRSGQNE